MKEPNQNPITSATKRDVPSPGRVTYLRREPGQVSYSIVLRAK